jgi:hypothetical protein
VKLEQHLHVNLELTGNVWLASHTLLADVASWYYQVAHLTVTLSLLLFVYWRRPDLYRVGRSALVLTNVIALAVFWLNPVAPPRLLPGAGYVDVALATGVSAQSATSAPNPFAAMPSLHTAWAVWCAILGLLLFRSIWARVVCCAYPVVTVIVIVTTGNHFVLDAGAGAAVAVFAFAAAAWASGSRFGRIEPADLADSEERHPDRAGSTFAAQAASTTALAPASRCSYLGSSGTPRRDPRAPIGLP